MHISILCIYVRMCVHAHVCVLVYTVTFGGHGIYYAI